MSTHPIKAARVARHLTQTQLAVQVGFPPHSGQVRIAEWERGTWVPSRVYAHLLAPHLGYSCAWDLREACLKWRREQNREREERQQPLPKGEGLATHRERWRR